MEIYILDFIEKYKKICQNRLEDEALSQRSVSEHINKMDIQGIIQAKTISKGR